MACVVAFLLHYVQILSATKRGKREIQNLTISRTVRNTAARDGARMARMDQNGNPNGGPLKSMLMPRDGLHWCVPSVVAAQVC